MITDTASFLAFPLRLQDGFLRRSGAADAVVSLLQVMAATSYGGWNGCEHFGVREYFEHARKQPELPEAAIHEMNAALEDLGISHIRVASITKDAQSGPDGDAYIVTLSTAEQKLRKNLAFRF